MIVYRLHNTKTGKSYIGQTANTLRHRILDHKALALRGGGKLVHRAIRKHGWDAFEVDVLEEAEDRDDLDMAERFWIKTCNSLSPHGYNLEAGGVQRNEISEQARANMSRGQTGRKASDETRALMSATRAGRPIHAVHRERLGDLNRGVPKTPEIKARISASLTGKKHSEVTKARRAQSLPNGEKHPNAKLTWEKVREIRRRHALGDSAVVLAAEFRTDKSNVHLILKGKAWKKDPLNLG